MLQHDVIGFHWDGLAPGARRHTEMEILIMHPDKTARSMRAPLAAGLVALMLGSVATEIGAAQAADAKRSATSQRLEKGKPRISSKGPAMKGRSESAEPTKNDRGNAAAAHRDETKKVARRLPDRRRLDHLVTSRKPYSPQGSPTGPHGFLVASRDDFDTLTQPQPAARGKPEATSKVHRRAGAASDLRGRETVWDRLHRLAEERKPVEAAKVRTIKPHQVGRQLPWEAPHPTRMARPAVSPQPQVHQTAHTARQSQPSSVQEEYGGDESDAAPAAGGDIVHMSITAEELGIDTLPDSYHLPVAQAVHLLLHVSGIKPSDSSAHSRASLASRTTSVFNECLAQYPSRSSDVRRKVITPKAPGLPLSEIDGTPGIVALIARVTSASDEAVYAVLRHSTYGKGWEAVTFAEQPERFNGEVVSELLSEPVDESLIRSIVAYVQDKPPEGS